MSRGRPSRPGDDGSPAQLIPGRQPVREALRAGRRLDHVVLDRRGGPILQQIGEDARAAGVDVRVATRDEMDAMTGDVQHQGALATAGPFPFVPLEQLLAGDLVVVLDGITDPRNLGAIARVAEQAGAVGLVIRDRRAAGPSPAAEKAAAGALSWLPIAQVTNISRALEALSGAGLWSIGLAGEGETTVWDQPLFDERVALVIGEEGSGLSRLVAERVDALVSIPMGGQLDSLNASTAAAVAAFEWRRRHHRP
jgi:23S rRNA (guanosine2251-2'-O)-methyltransferase